jgi:hypothetical protein
MDISSIYIHDGCLLRVIEDTKAATLTMGCELPVGDWSDDLVPTLLVFDDFSNYRICEGAIDGCPTLLDMKIVSERNGRVSLRLDTTAGYRELDCRAVRLVDHDISAKYLQKI